MIHQLELIVTHLSVSSKTKRFQFSDSLITGGQARGKAVPTLGQANPSRSLHNKVTTRHTLCSHTGKPAGIIIK